MTAGRPCLLLIRYDEIKGTPDTDMRGGEQREKTRASDWNEESRSCGPVNKNKNRSRYDEIIFGEKYITVYNNVERFCTFVPPFQFTDIPGNSMLSVFFSSVRVVDRH